MDSVKNARRIEGYEDNIKTYFGQILLQFCFRFATVNPGNMLSDNVFSRFEYFLYGPVEILSDSASSRHTPEGTPGEHSSSSWSLVAGAQLRFPPPSEWPREIFSGDGKNIASKEMVLNLRILTFAFSANEEKGGKSSDILDINRFSSKGELLRVLIWMFRFIENVRIKKELTDIGLTASELEIAENFIIGKKQLEQFG